MRYLWVAVLFAGALCAEPTIAFWTHVDAATCGQANSINPFGLPCTQNVFVVAHGDQSVKRFLIQIVYKDQTGAERSQSMTTPTAEGYAAAGFYNVDNIILERIIAEPLLDAGPAVVVEVQK